MASRRQYLSQTELADFADIQVIDPTEADDRISQAEEIIDGYVGAQSRFLSTFFPDIEGLVASINGANQFTLEARHQNVYLNNFFTYCEVEIIGGGGAGQRSIITASSYSGVITAVANFSPAIDTTSFYRIYQLGKFPRFKDVYLDAIHTPNQYYKTIKEEIKRATAAQVEYMIEQGDDFFRGNDIFINNEKLGDYTYDKARDGSGTGITQLIAPKAKLFLTGFVNRRGQITV